MIVDEAEKLFYKLVKDCINKVIIIDESQTNAMGPLTNEIILDNSNFSFMTQLA